MNAEQLRHYGCMLRQNVARRAAVKAELAEHHVWSVVLKEIRADLLRDLKQHVKGGL